MHSQWQTTVRPRHRPEKKPRHQTPQAFQAFPQERALEQRWRSEWIKGIGSLPRASRTKHRLLESDDSSLILFGWSATKTSSPALPVRRSSAAGFATQHRRRYRRKADRSEHRRGAFNRNSNSQNYTPSHYWCQPIDKSPEAHYRRAETSRCFDRSRCRQAHLEPRQFDRIRPGW